MSIEATLTRLAEALEANTNAIDKMIEASGGKAPAKTPAKTPAKAPAKAPAKSAASKTTKSKGEIKVEDVADRVTSYMKTGDADERATRKAQVMQIIEHFGADRFTTIDQEHLEEALAMLDTFEEGGEPDFGGDDDGEAMV